MCENFLIKSSLSIDNYKENTYQKWDEDNELISNSIPFACFKTNDFRENVDNNN